MLVGIPSTACVRSCVSRYLHSDLFHGSFGSHPSLHCHTTIHGKSPCRPQWSILWCASPRRPKFWAFLSSFARRRLKNMISVGVRITGLSPCMPSTMNPLYSYIMVNGRDLAVTIASFIVLAQCTPCAVIQWSMVETWQLPSHPSLHCPSTMHPLHSYTMVNGRDLTVTIALAHTQSKRFV